VESSFIGEFWVVEEEGLRGRKEFPTRWGFLKMPDERVLKVPFGVRADWTGVIRVGILLEEIFMD